MPGYNDRAEALNGDFCTAASGDFVTATDTRLAAAVVDRLTFKAHIIETGSESYRLRLSRDPKGAAREG